MLEGLERQGWLDLTFGLLDGWWRFDDAVRNDYALMNVAQWSSVLSQQGFSDVAVIHPSGVATQAVVAARGPSTVEQSAAPGVWLLAADVGDVAEQLAQRSGYPGTAGGAGPAGSGIDPAGRTPLAVTYGSGRRLEETA